MKKSLKQKLALLLAIIMMFTMSVPFGIIAGAADDVTDPPVVGDGEGEEPVDPPAPTAAEPLTDDVTDKVDVNSVTSSSDGFANEGAGNLFSADYGTKFCGNTDVPETPLVFAWSMTEPVAVQTYALTSGGDSSKYSARDPKAWNFYGSNDGETWVLLDSRVSQGFAADNLTKVYPFVNEVAYSQYKLEITAHNGVNMIQLCAIQLSTASLADQDADNAAKEAAAAFDEKLAEFGVLNADNYTEERYEEYKALRSEYEALDPTTKSFVKNSYVIDESQKYVDTMGMATVVKDLITEIKAAMTDGTYDYRINGKITDALTIYNGLTEDQKAQIDEADITALNGYRNTLDEELNSQFNVSANVSTGSNAKPTWLQNMTEEEIAATAQAAADELKYQYSRLGYMLGNYDTTGTVTLNVAWESYIISEREGGTNDNVTNPWDQAGRKWSAIIVPFAGTAFSVTGYMAATSDGMPVVISDNFIYNGRVYQQRNNMLLSYPYGYEAPIENDIAKPVFDVVSNFPGNDGNADITKNTFRYAYARYNSDNKLDDKVLGIPNGYAVTTEDGVIYQAFEGPDGDAYIVTSTAAVNVANANEPAKTAYVVNGDILAALLADGKDFAEVLAETGAPIAEVKDGTQLFENGVASKDGFAPYSAENEYLKVINMIDKLPSGVTSETFKAVGEALEAAQIAYDALTVNKDKVSNVEALNTLKAAYDKLAVDMGAAADVDALISAIGEVTLESEAAINAADNAYNALTAEQKALVENYPVLNSAKIALQRLIDEEAIKAVEELIKALPADQEIDGDNLAAASEKVNAALDAYNALTSSQQNGVAQDLLEELDTKVDIVKAGGYTKWEELQKKPTGDIDNNGVVNVSDIMTLKNLIMNSSWTPEQLARGDMNSDGTLTVSDMLSIKSIIMGS